VDTEAADETQESRPPSGGTPDLQQVEAKTDAGITLMLLRHFLVLSMQIGAGIILARKLLPQDFGMFAIATFFVSSAQLVVDLGLPTALLREPRRLTQRELVAVFSAQMLLALLFVGALSAFAGPLAGLYADIPAHMRLVIIGASAGLILFPLRTIPALLLERTMRYRAFVIPESLQGISQATTATVLALANLRVWALVFSPIVASVVGLIALFRIQPWRPRFSADLHPVRRFLQFAVFFQGTSVVAVVQNAILPLYIARRLGTAAAGLIAWAAGRALKLQEIVNIVGNVSMVGCARLQEDPDALRTYFERNLRVCAFVVFPLATIASVLGEPILRIVYSDRWIPAIPLFRIYVLSLLPITALVLTVRLLAAIGRARLIFVMSTASAVLLWLLTVLLCERLGPLGAAIAFAATNLLGATAYVLATRDILVPVAPRALVRPILSCVPIAVGALYMSRRIASILDLLISVAILLLVYAITLIVIGERPGKAWRVIVSEICSPSQSQAL